MLSSCCQRRQLDFEELAGIDTHRREVPGDFEAHEAVQAAPDKNSAQGRHWIGIKAVPLRPGRELGRERLTRRGGRAVAELAERLEQELHRTLRCLDQSLRVRVV